MKGGQAAGTVAATVIITDGSDEAQKLMDQMMIWAAAGLIDSSWWLDGRSLGPSDVGGRATPLNATGMRAISATLVEADGARLVQFLPSLGVTAYEVCRIVMVHMLTLGSSGDVEIARHTNNFVEQLRPNIPASSTMAKLNLLIPVTGAESVDPQILQPGWQANLLVSPEDEVSDRHSSVGVAHPGNLISHAALHVATVGGMWSGMESGPFDRSSESSDGEPDPITARAFVRVVRSRDIVDEIAVAAIGEAGDTGWDLPSDEGTGDQPLQASNPATVLADALEAAGALDDGMLRFNPGRQLDAPQPTPIGILKSLALIFRYFWASVVRLPEAAVGRLRQAVTELAEDRATNFAFGDDGLFVARLGGEPADRDAAASPELEHVTNEATRILTLLGARTTVGPTPVLWQALRRFCFAIVDGSEPPSELPIDTVGSRRQLITRPELIVSDPDNDYFELSAHVILGTGLSQWSGIRVSACDAYLARRLETDLRSASERIKLLAGSNPIPSDRQVQEQVDHELARILDWILSRHLSFLWQLSERIGGQLNEADVKMKSALPIVVEGWSNIDFHEPSTRLRHLNRAWLVTFLFTIAGVVTLWRWEEVRPNAPAVTPILLVTAFLISFILFREYLRAIYKWEANAERTIASYKQALSDLRVSSQETVRLGAIYQQYIEWAEIIGWILHHPWTPYGGEVRESLTPIFEDAYAIQITEARPSDEHVQLLGTRARHDLIHVGWLGACYEAVAQQAEATTAIATGSTNQQRLSADVDTPFQPNGARTALLETLRTKRPQELARDQAVSAVATFCAGLPPADVFHDVGSVEVDGQQYRSVDDFLGLTPPAAGAQPFDSRLWTAEDLVDGAAAVSSTSIWMWGADPGGVGGYQLAAASPTTDQQGSYIARSIRLDLSSRRPTSSYLCFAARSSDPEPAHVNAAQSDGDGDRLY